MRILTFVNMVIKAYWLWATMIILGCCRVDAGGYAIVNLGTLGGTSSTATAINQRGNVVGWALDNSGKKQAFAWRDGVMTGLGFLPGSTSSVASSINYDGVITGTSSYNPTNQLAFIYQSNTLSSLGTLGGLSSSGRDINDRMEITGWSQASNNIPDYRDPQSFFWSSNKIFRVRSFHNYSSNEGHSINESGTVAGITAAWTPNLRWWAYVWIDSNGNHTNETGEMKLLGTLGGASSVARCINDRNQVVGTAQTTQLISRAFLVTQTGGLWKYPPPEELVFTNAFMQDLGSLQGPLGSSDAFSINNLGTIVGTSSSTNGDRAFIWRGGKMNDLNDFLPVDSGWTLQGATGINDRDEIVGYGLYQGQTRAFLMHRPSQITDYRGDILFNQTVVSNQIDGVYTQLNSRLVSLNMNWSSIWSDPPTDHVFILEFQQPDVDPSWYTASVVGSDTVLAIPTNHPLVATNQLLWFRMKAVW